MWSFSFFSFVNSAQAIFWDGGGGGVGVGGETCQCNLSGELLLFWSFLALFHLRFASSLKYLKIFVLQKLFFLWEFQAKFLYLEFSL